MLPLLASGLGIAYLKQGINSMAEIRKPVEFTGLPDGHAMLTPFGPHIVYSRMPNKIVKKAYVKIRKR